MKAAPPHAKLVPVASARPHLIGIDDGPFEKGQREAVPVVGVMMECPSPVEAVALTELAVDTENATDQLANWICGLRCYPSLQAIILGGITIAGLGMVDTPELARRLARPVLVVNRRDPAGSRLAEALHAAGLEGRLPILRRSPPALRVADGLFLAWAGAERAQAERFLRASLGKAQLPEPLRIAHMIARALARGESRGRV